MRRVFDTTTPAGRRFWRYWLAGVAMAGLVTAGWQQWLHEATERRVAEEATRLEGELVGRLEAYVALLRGVAGLFAANERVTRVDFKAYVAQLGVERNYPGTQGIGFSQRVPPADLANVIADRRQQGAETFHVWPEDPRREYHTIVFLEPEDRRNLAALGYDMHTDAVRREAMDHAGRSGGAAVSGVVTLVQEIDAQKQPGFLIYYPVYRQRGGGVPASVEERERTLAGFVYAPFRAADFLRNRVARTERQGICLTIWEGDRPDARTRLFVTSGGASAPGGGWSRVGVTRSLPMLNRVWTFRYETAVTGWLPWWAVWLIGIAGASVLAVLVDRERRALELAEESAAARRDREQQLALLMDVMPLLVVFVDRAGVFRLVNARLQEWFGVEPRMLIGRPLREVARGETYAELEPIVRRALAGEKVAFERWFGPSAGEAASPLPARYLSVHLVPYRDGTGQVVGFYAVASDLTAHIHAEQGARFVADCSNLLIAAASEGAIMQGLVRLAVPRVADGAVIFKVTPEKLRVAAIAHREAEAEVLLRRRFGGFELGIEGASLLARAARTGRAVALAEIQSGDLRRLFPDPDASDMERLGIRSVLHVPVVVRDRVWAVLTLAMAGSGRRYSTDDLPLAEEISTRIRLSVENALLFREARQEIEERRRAERTARESEERFRLLVEGARDYAMILLDADGKIASWNPGAGRLLGFSEQEALGLPFAMLFSADDRAAGLPGQELETARKAGSAPDERWHLRKDGSRFWASGHTVALRDEQGGVRGFAKVMRDLTGWKLSEEELERRVHQRTLELNEAVQELEAFSYSVSHDLRSPLRSIQSFTSFTIEEASDRLNPTERGYLERVQRSAARLDRLISDLLAYTRVSKTRVPLEPVSLDALVGQIQREHPEFNPPHATVEIRGPLGRIVGNEAYVTQCVTNLLGNAVKFVAPGRVPAVKIWGERIGANVRLHFQDNGIGVPPEHAARIFQIFERLHPGGSYEGTGVGLAIVRRAAQRMNGSVGVRPTPEGEGSVFWLELPAANDAV
ncbi:MAG: CHASE domain-containing protein [Opitutae bacterium]|nr:CHASE domain-containing protein [Opitutae bacterium]